MTNQTEVKEVVAAEEAPKKARRSFPKHQTSAQEIIAKVEHLEKEVKELEDAQHHVGNNEKLRAIVGKELMGKKKELADVLNEVYYF